jgi:nucleoside-triphosphatase THEP1
LESAPDSDLIKVDEIGHLEQSSHKFILAVEKAIASPKPMLLVLHEWSNHSLAKKIRGSFKVITVTQENSDALEEEIAKEIRGRR